MLQVVCKLKSLKRPLKLLSGNKFGEIHKKAQIAYEKPLDIQKKIHSDLIGIYTSKKRKP